MGSPQMPHIHRRCSRKQSQIYDFSYFILDVIDCSDEVFKGMSSRTHFTVLGLDLGLVICVLVLGIVT